MEDFIEIGQVIKPFGVKGELSLRLYIDEASDLKGLKSFIIKDKKAGWREVPFTSLVFSEDCTYARVFFPEVASRTEAEVWRQISLFVPKNFLKLPKGSFFVGDLVGCDAFFNDSSIGVVDNFIDIAGTDMLVIKTETQMLAVPMTQRYIKEIDTASKRLVFQQLDELM